MTNLVSAQGALLGRYESALFDQGAFATAPVAVVLTVTRDQLLFGTRSATAPFDGAIEFKSGSAKIYDLNPVSIRPLSGKLVLGEAGSATFVSSPAGTFADFAIYKDGSTDPLTQGHVQVGNNGASTGAVGQPWSRHYRIFYPPRGARFVVPHFRVRNTPASTSQYFDAFQAEVLTKDATSVSAYDSPRSIRPVVNPTRLNFSRNPRGEAGNTTSWTGVTINASGGFNSNGIATHTLTGLTPNIAYVVSAWVWGDVSLEGEINVSETDGAAKRIWTVIVPGKSTATVTFRSGSTYRVDQVLAEVGTVVGDYFDGDSGDEYLWEQNGTPGSCRSYFYEDRTNRHYLLVKTLQENVPMGVSVIDPEYALKPPVYRLNPPSPNNYGYGLYDGGTYGG